MAHLARGLGPLHIRMSGSKWRQFSANPAQASADRCGAFCIQYCSLMVRVRRQGVTSSTPHLDQVAVVVTVPSLFPHTRARGDKARGVTYHFMKPCHCRCDYLSVLVLYITCASTSYCGQVRTLRHGYGTVLLSHNQSPSASVHSKSHWKLQMLPHKRKVYDSLSR